MTINEWRTKCEPGCTCGKHRKREYEKCQTGCDCPRHWKRKECPDGCTCNRHAGKQKCQPGCVCGRHSRANKFTPEQRAEARERSLAKGREYAKRRRLTNPEHVDTVRERYRLHGRRWHLKSKYGLTLEEWDTMLIQQTGLCYLCSEPLNPFDTTTDHDHDCCPGKGSCGKCIRGLACRWCNQGIGSFRDDPERMRRAADALEAAMMQLATRS